MFVTPPFPSRLETNLFKPESLFLVY